MNKHWKISVCTDGSSDEYSLPGTLPADDVKGLLRLLVARSYKPDEIIDSFKTGKPWQSPRLEIWDSGNRFTCGHGEPYAHAVLETIPEQKH